LNGAKAARKQQNIVAIEYISLAGNFGKSKFKEKNNSK
jgi:hypothetical protein